MTYLTTIYYISISDADGDDEGLDEVGMAALLLQNERNEQLADDELIASQEPPNISQLLKKRAVEKDTGRLCIK
jgi:hypothetical protein